MIRRPRPNQQLYSSYAKLHFKELYLNQIDYINIEIIKLY